MMYAKKIKITLLFQKIYRYGRLIIKTRAASLCQPLSISSRAAFLAASVTVMPPMIRASSSTRA